MSHPFHDTSNDNDLTMTTKQVSNESSFFTKYKEQLSRIKDNNKVNEELTDVEGNEGLGNFISSIFKAIRDMLKKVWNALFGNNSGFKISIRNIRYDNIHTELKDAKIKSKGVSRLHTGLWELSDVSHSTETPNKDKVLKTAIRNFKDVVQDLDKVISKSTDVLTSNLEKAKSGQLHNLDVFALIKACGLEDVTSKVGGDKNSSSFGFNFKRGNKETIKYLTVSSINNRYSFKTGSFESEKDTPKHIEFPEKEYLVLDKTDFEFIKSFSKTSDSVYTKLDKKVRALVGKVFTDQVGNAISSSVKDLSDEAMKNSGLNVNPETEKRHNNEATVNEYIKAISSIASCIKLLLSLLVNQYKNLYVPLSQLLDFKA